MDGAVTNLALAASSELARREKWWPVEVAEGRMAEADAARDIAAWRAIAALLANEQPDLDPLLGATTNDAWASIWKAADTAVERRLAAPATAANETRVAALAAIRARLLPAAARAGVFAGVFEQERKAA